MRDEKLIFSEAQSIVGSAGDIVSTNVIDCSVANPSVGDGRAVFLNVSLPVAVTSSGSATVAFTLEGSADNSSFATVYTTGALALTALTLGKTIVRMPLPEGLAKRYLRMKYTVATAATTAGKVDAWLDIN